MISLSTTEKDNEPGKPKTDSTPTRPEDQDASRRRFLKVGLTVGVVMVFGGIAAVARSLISPSNPPQVEAGGGAKTSTVTVTVGSLSSGNETGSASGSTSTSQTSSSPFPRFKVANLSDVSASTPVYFNYPLDETPNILVKLGVKAEGGVGPDGDIVAFSTICQHLGCIYGFVPSGKSPTCDSTYKAAGPEGYCCCHGTAYDLTKAGAVITGPSPRPVPQVTLEFDSSSGDIFAVGMGPPTIFGHDTGSTDVLNDLQGGTVV